MTFENKNQVTIIGLGYVGLPLLIACAQSGFRVVGIDTNSSKVKKLKDGYSYIDDIDSELLCDILQLDVSFETNLDMKNGSKIWVICVPTPLQEDYSPNLNYVIDAANYIAPRLSHNDLVILESTTYPGTTDTLLVNIFLKYEKILGKDYLLAYAPERVDPGQSTVNYREIPRVIGGVDSLSLQSALNFYNKFINRTVIAKTSREAEMSKLIENSFRHINIAFINELSQYTSALNIDLWNALDCAETKPYGFMRFNPGAGVGGHCIPIDPNYLSFEIKSKLKKNFRFVELATAINNEMPELISHKVLELIDQIDNPKVVLLGLSYKKNISDTRESPGLKICEKLRKNNISILLYDPLVKERLNYGNNIVWIEDENLIFSSDLCLIIQFHDIFKTINFSNMNIVLDVTGNVQGKNVFQI